jgi:hypothetical protein
LAQQFAVPLVDLSVYPVILSALISAGKQQAKSHLQECYIYKMLSFKTYQYCYYTRFLNAIEVKAKPL